jgi:hypothetical protein
MPSAVEIRCVDPARIREVWPFVAPLLKSAIDRAGLSCWDEIADDILKGSSLIWICGDSERILCAGATRLEKTNSGSVCVIVACGGSDMRRWLHLLERVESYARAEGCRSTRIFGRAGWERVLDGYGVRNVVLEKELS